MFANISEEVVEVNHVEVKDLHYAGGKRRSGLQEGKLECGEDLGGSGDEQVVKALILLKGFGL